MLSLPELLCRAGALMFDRQLTDMAGGNISVRDGDTVYMSPRYAGQQYHWSLTPDVLVTGRWADDEITLKKDFSREGWSHLYLYRAFPNIKAVIHAHPFYVMPFVALCRPMEPMLEATQKFGQIGYCEPAPGHTKQLAENIVQAMQGKEAQMKTQAAVVLIPYHGIILAGEDFDKTLDALERVNKNGYCVIARKALE